jgi:hypothetical protein
MTREKVLQKMAVELPAAASPARVAELATMLQRALEAADDSLGDGSVTMIVNNFDMRAELRARDTQGAKAVRVIGQVMADPAAAVRKRPEARRVAEAIAKYGTGIAQLKAEVRVGKKKTSFDDEALGAIRGVATELAVKVRRVAGNTFTHSRVLRVGRDRESADVRARIEIHGEYRDVLVDKSAVPGFIDAVRAEDLYRIELSLEWVLGDSGRSEIDPRSVRATRLHAFAPITGDELMEMVVVSEQAAIAFSRDHEADA